MKNKQCCRCKEIKEIRYFTRDISRKDGFNNTCKLCRGTKEENIREHRPAVKQGFRYCSKCNAIKSIEEFSLRTIGGGHCKVCVNIKSTEWYNFKIKTGDIHVRYGSAKSYAKRANIPFFLTEKEYSDLMKNNCYYCNNPLSYSGIQLDRIDNNKTVGYISVNVLPCCTVCNRVRGDHFTIEETKIAIKAVLNFREKSNK